MKVITATNRTQGQRSSDFHWCIEGEVVAPPVIICDADRDDPDGGCGCGRSWSGTNSHKATTTAMVRELEGYTAADFAEAVRSSMLAAGWYPDHLDDDALSELIAELTETAESYPVDAVLETRLGEIRWRDTTEQTR